MSDERILTDDEIWEFRKDARQVSNSSAALELERRLANTILMLIAHIEATDTHPEFRQIRAEILRQDEKWGDQSGHPLPLWYTILGEEVGEVAQAILQQKPDECLKELIQVAAVAVQMHAAIQKANGPG